MKNHKLSKCFQLVLISLFLSAAYSDSFGGGKAGLYGIYMVPDGKDAENYSRPGFGLGIHIVMPVPKLANIFAGTAGSEFFQ